MHRAVEMDRIEDRRRHDVAARARERRGQRGVLVRGVRGGGRPWARAHAMAGPAQAAAVPEVDLAIEVERAPAQRGARGVGFRVAPAAGARVVAGRRREVAVLAGDGRRRLGPGDVRLRPALGVAVNGARAAGAVVARLPGHDGRVERDLGDAVAVEARDHSGPRHRVARRARHSA